MPQRLFQRVSAKPSAGDDSPWRRSVRWLIGPQLVDLPIRVVAVIYVISNSSPRAYQSDEPGYVALHLLGQVCFVMAAFFPTIAGLSSVGLFVIFLVVYPEFINPLLEPITFAAAVLLAKIRWWLALLFGASAFCLTWLEHQTQVAVPTHYSLVAFILATKFALALAGAYLSWHVENETKLRVEAARRNEELLQNERLAAITDIHDTLSHSHATQAAIMQVLAAESDAIERKRLFGELAIMNAEAQQQFRNLLTRLAERDENRPAVEGSFETEVHRIAEHLRDAAATGGIHIRVHISKLPKVVASGLMDDIAFILRELVTNMIKHAEPGECELSVSYEHEAERPLLLTATNASSQATAFPPRTIHRRVSVYGGSCTVEQREGIYTVTLALPVSAERYPYQGMPQLTGTPSNGVHEYPSGPSEHSNPPAGTRRSDVASTARTSSQPSCQGACND